MRMSSAEVPPTYVVAYIKLAAMSNKFFVTTAMCRPTPIKGQATRALCAMVMIPGVGREQD